MTYSVLIRRRAQEELGKLPPEIRQRIYAALLALEENPRPPACRKLKDRQGWRLRIGDYRMIYDIDDPARQVAVLRVAHRREVYR